MATHLIQTLYCPFYFEMFRLEKHIILFVSVWPAWPEKCMKAQITPTGRSINNLADWCTENNLHNFSKTEEMSVDFFVFLLWFSLKEALNQWVEQVRIHT